MMVNDLLDALHNMPSNIYCRSYVYTYIDTHAELNRNKNTLLEHLTTARRQSLYRCNSIYQDYIKILLEHLTTTARRLYRCNTIYQDYIEK